MSESNAGLTFKSHVVKHGCWALFFIGKHDPSDLVAARVGVMDDLPPLVVHYTILVDVLKDLNFISPTVDEKSILIANEGMVSPGFRHLIKSS